MKVEIQFKDECQDQAILEEELDIQQLKFQVGDGSAGSMLLVEMSSTHSETS